jgi:hypothetical protein
MSLASLNNLNNIGSLGIQKPSGLGAELITNGDFTTDVSGWTSGNSATLASVAGGQSGNCLQVTNGAAYGSALQGVTTLLGVTYRLTVYFQKGTAAGGLIYIGNTAGNSEVYASSSLTDASWTQYTINFIAQNTTTYVSLYVNSGTVAETAKFDTVSLRRVF